jgi:hypothetical protein
MSKYKGLFTYDIDNHRYIPVEQADGLISDMNYCPEPKKYWYITGEGGICIDDIKYSDWIEERKSIGNYFETEAEAEKAVEKLKAFKRLKDKGFVFEYYILDSGYNKIIFDMPIENEQDLESSRGDLDLLFFGGEE